MNNLSHFRSVQRSVAARAKAEDSPDLKSIKYIGAFDTAVQGNKLVCAGVILKADTLEVVERNVITLDSPLKFIRGYEAFRAGPAILQLFYELEYTPQLIMVDGTGIAHKYKCGLASYIGTELDIPTIGVGKKAAGDVEEGNIIVDNEIRGVMVSTKEFANPVAVSPGHLISIETAAEWVRKTIVPPHKNPEPLHIASRMARKAAKRGSMDE